MNNLSLMSNSAASTKTIGVRMGQLSEPGDVFLLSGDLGAGKTCLTQGMACGLGIEGYVRSPTFVLVSQHHGRLPLYHMDMYRLGGLEEVLDLGLEEYLLGSGVSVVEWADKSMGAFQQPFLVVSIGIGGMDERCLTFQAYGQRYEDLIQMLSDEFFGIKRY